MPSEPPESNFKHKIKLTTYPCRERGGVIWTYMGPSQLQPGLPDLDWALVPESHRFISRRWQECNWLQAMEGGIDSIHIPFLYRDAAKTGFFLSFAEASNAAKPNFRSGTPAPFVSVVG